jgi:hypothetical protein
MQGIFFVESTAGQLCLHWTRPNGTISPHLCLRTRCVNGVGEVEGTTANIHTLQGYQMAKNLQSKLGSKDRVWIFDINKEAMQNLAKEMQVSSSGASVELAESAADASKEAVSFAVS